jgi:hypothetical protein
VNLDRATERAESATTERQAASLYNDIEYELAFGDPNAAQEAEGEQAISILERRFPGIQEQARDVTSPPHTSRTASRNRRGETHSQRGESQRRPSSTPPRRAPQTRASAPRSRSSSPSPRSSGGRRASSSSGALAAAGASATDTILTGLTWILLAGLGYFLLTPKGAGGLSTVLGGVIKGVDLIVQPVDPLGGSLSASASGGGGGTQAANTIAGALRRSTQAVGAAAAGTGAAAAGSGAAQVLNPPASVPILGRALAGTNTAKGGS